MGAQRGQENDAPPTACDPGVTGVGCNRSCWGIVHLPLHRPQCLRKERVLQPMRKPCGWKSLQRRAQGLGLCAQERCRERGTKGGA